MGLIFEQIIVFIFVAYIYFVKHNIYLFSLNLFVSVFNFYS